MLYSLVTYVTKNGIGEYVIIRRIEKGLFMSESVLSFLEEKNLPEVIKKKHTYLMMDGHDQEDIYVLDTFNKLGYKAKINTHTTSYIN